MKEFISLYDIDDISKQTWLQISDRLIEKVQLSDYKLKTKRYKNLPKSDDKLKKVNLFTYSNQEFNGILNFFSKKSGGKIDSEISITSSSINPSDNSSNPRNVAYNNNNYFFSDNFVNSWICFDFKDYRVSPTNYTIKTVGNYYPKSWVIEGSNDNVSFEILDSQNNCSRLNNRSVVCTFTIGVLFWMKLHLCVKPSQYSCLCFVGFLH